MILVDEQRTFITKATNRELRYGFKVVNVPFDKIAIDYQKVESLCNGHCKLYGTGGCPPNSPSMVKLLNKYHKATMLVLEVPVHEWMTDKVKSKPESTRAWMFITQSHNTMEHHERLLRLSFKGNGSGLFLGTGYCKACQWCVITEGKPCAKPKERRYSLESTGVMVSKTMKACGLEGLDWFNYKGHEPELLKRVMMYLSL